MPEMDGIQCLHALRTQPGGLCQDVPVIALTANAGSDNQLLYRKEGFSGYLAKPVSGALLEAAVLSILPKELVKLSEEGRFLDELELKADELLSHIALGKNGYSSPPEVEDYERFFAEKLTESQNIIHITMAKHASQGYYNALEAAKSFENVSISLRPSLQQYGPYSALCCLHGRESCYKNRDYQGCEKVKTLYLLCLYH